ncbi:mannitol-1-phosphate 5-dehydrogenase [Virgibacillus ihumii]|uniref:mannitol-1-phosphate 5-dehydrogenase n=1 Tax=Virgibacillus ihumii TaxID=2686091 RepID=UPI00157BD412|nr:mannitol-1-phosphate 5-dehydrogenase [Virgibacillus ihumii]
MLAVHFGAGNIGRGFIGELLFKAGYHTTFVDVNEAVINELNAKKEYNVILAAENSETLTVKDVSGINSVSDPDDVVDAIVKADVVTTAVGPNILPIIAELIARGLRKRAARNLEALNLIACENMIGGSELLKEKVYEHLAPAERGKFDELFGFPNAAVDRIVPNQSNEDLLTVSVEPYYEWVVERAGIKGVAPDVDGITYVDDLQPYIERKLFTVNTGHAVPAYIGQYMGYETINEAMQDPHIQEIINGALRESGEVLIQTYDFNRETHEEYIDKIIARFKNPYISDDVKRVGRGPIRKLGAMDRLVRPATEYVEVTGKNPVYLAKIIAAALHFHDEEDDEAVKLQEIIAEDGYERALQKVSGLESDDRVLTAVLEELEKLKKLK